MKKLTVCISILILFGCSDQKNTFSLVCKGKSTLNTLRNFSVVSSEVVDETRTYSFENKNFGQHKCTEFIEKSIKCSYIYNFSSEIFDSESDYISIDRISGQISHQYNYIRGMNQHKHTWFKGICEKSISKF